MDEDELSYTEEDKSECAIKKQKDANNEVTYDVTKYFNAFIVFECRRNILGRLDVSYERACMEIQLTISDSEYFDSEEQVDTKIKSEKLVDAISDSEEQVDAVSEKKVYRDYIFRNEFETMNVFEQENNSGS